MCDEGVAANEVEGEGEGEDGGERELAMSVGTV
jgi:hypothetical protein